MVVEPRILPKSGECVKTKMSKPIIKVENLSKQYRIGARADVYGTFRESLTGAMKAPLKRLRRNGKDPDKDTIWALNDVSFEVQSGEVVGIIGGNGAGKSTLLKVLSRITEPTMGSIKLYGRIASLLEVGTGFHPELTGRENIYLNGAILGMAKREIERKFDEMVDFAEVEKFIDTPVKRYSSGMYLRLAFAVAAHLDPEILVVDEVLAVGDAAFQKKCLGKMGEVAREGRTVLFVSHNFEAVRSLCSRCLLLKQGQLMKDSLPEICIESISASLRGSYSAFKYDLETWRKDAKVPLPSSVEIRGVNKSADETITFDDDILATLVLDSPILLDHTFMFQILTETGMHIFNSFYRDDTNNSPLEPGTTTQVSVVIPRQFLSEGIYEASFGYMLPNSELFWLTRNTWFDVIDLNSYRNSGINVKRTGIVSMILPWHNLKGSKNACVGNGSTQIVWGEGVNNEMLGLSPQVGKSIL